MRTHTHTLTQNKHKRGHNFPIYQLYSVAMQVVQMVQYVAQNDGVNNRNSEISSI